MAKSVAKGNPSIPEDIFVLKRPITKKELVGWTGFTERFIDLEVGRGHLRKRFSGRASRFMPEDIKAWFQRKAEPRKRQRRTEVGIAE